MNRQMNGQLRRFLPLKSLKLREETKGRFRKRVVLANVASFWSFVPGEHANVPSFRFSFWGNIRMYPRSGFRSGGTSAKPPFLKTTLCLTAVIVL